MATVVLDANPAIDAWLGQFRELERPLAGRLLDALTIVPAAVVQSSLTKFISELINERSGPIACFAVRKVHQGKYFSSSTRSGWRTAKPAPVQNAKDGVGSEGQVANWITTWTRLHAGVLLNHPSLQTMADARARHLVFVDDIVGSGKRATEFINAIRSHKTIRSWVSGKRITFHYFAYAVSARGEGMISRYSNPGVDLRFSIRPTFGRELWQGEEYGEMVQFCHRVAKRTKNDWMLENATGFGGSFAVLVFDYSCPNNTPSILWHACDTWNPLFPKQGVPADLPLQDVETRMGAHVSGGVGVARKPMREPPLLDRKRRLNANRIEGRKCLALLVGLSKGIRREGRLAEFAGLDLYLLRRLLDRCENGLFSDIRG